MCDVSGVSNCLNKSSNTKLSQCVQWKWDLKNEL